MKRFGAVLVAVVVVFFVSSPVFADSNAVAVDSLRAAQVWGGVKVFSYVGQFSFQRDGKGDYVSANFKMALNGDVNYFEVNGMVKIGEGDKPSKGLPANAVGETRNFYLYLSALDDKGQAVAYGNFQKDLLLPGDPIVITLSPANWIMKVIPFVGEGAANAVLKTDSGTTANYSPQANGFIVYVDPMKDVTSYTIVDTTSGIILSSGVINPMVSNQKPNTNSVVNIMLAGGVTTVPDGDYAYLDNQKIAGQLADGTPAKVYIWSLNGKAGSVNTWSANGNPQVRILRWMSAGKMPAIATSDDYGNVSVGDGYDKVIVVITGTAGQDFQINFSTGSGGEKG